MKYIDDKRLAGGGRPAWTFSVSPMFRAVLIDFTCMSLLAGFFWVVFFCVSSHNTGFMLWYMSKELFQFKKLRQHYILRSNTSSSPTILLTSIPKNMLSVAALTDYFGPNVFVSINLDHTRLDELVKQRLKLARMLEGWETSFITKINGMALKKGAIEVRELGDISSLGPRIWVGKPILKYFSKKVDRKIVLL
jgi:Cytosolic domain of 10TM putative phosphate transporter